MYHLISFPPLNLIYVTNEGKFVWIFLVIFYFDLCLKTNKHKKTLTSGKMFCHYNIFTISVLMNYLGKHFFSPPVYPCLLWVSQNAFHISRNVRQPVFPAVIRRVRLWLDTKLNEPEPENRSAHMRHIVASQSQLGHSSVENKAQTHLWWWCSHLCACVLYCVKAPESCIKN